MAELPILPLNTEKLLSDTTHLSAEEFGVYCRLLFVMWRQRGRLTDNDREMATIGGVSVRKWRAIKNRVMRPMTVAGGQVSQKRLTDTWMSVQLLRQKRALAAQARWNGRLKAQH
jgi:uncharacterized protein YdaU (DUF1376 family)